MSLFNYGDFRLHSGAVSPFKVDCDSLTADDLIAIAARVAPRLPPYFRVLGVPAGGMRLAEAMKEYSRRSSGLLIVDDVLTTGGSMEEMRAQCVGYDVTGLVLFARGHCPPWVRAVWQMGEWLR